MLAVCRILACHPGVERAIVYGSRAKGTFRTGSDIDLTLVGARLSHVDLLRLMREFDESSIPYRVDLSLLESIQDSAVRSHIERWGQVFFQR